MSFRMWVVLCYERCRHGDEFDHVCYITTSKEVMERKKSCSNCYAYMNGHAVIEEIDSASIDSNLFEYGKERNGT